MERKFEIEAFRNIGFADEKPYRQNFIINNSLKKGEMGNLVILIGANNSGKSNVLDAIKAFSNGISDRDVTNLYLTDDVKNPSVSLVAKDGDMYAYSKYRNGEPILKCPKAARPTFNVEEYIFKDDNIDALKDQIHTIVNLESIINNNDNALKELIKIDLSKVNIQILKKAAIIAGEWCLSVLDDYSGGKLAAPLYDQFVKDIKNFAPIYMNLLKEYSSFTNKYNNKNAIFEQLNTYYKEKYDIEFVPSLYEYTEKYIGNQDLTCPYNTIERSQFFTSLFKSINIDISVIINAYNLFKKEQSIGVLKQLEKKLNAELTKISDNFNALYYLDDTPYKFEITLESGSLYFSLYRGEQNISLNYQSTGFRWFFDLYFNLLCSTKLKAGDIIIMDEPATNLHVKGQEELRKFLKEFAMKNDITIIIATHSPFLIDVDYLDEIRVVSNKDNVTSIDNEFSSINYGDPDALQPIKEALTVRNSILVDPDQTVIFVEGITDYNYLVGMKKVLNIENITFLPIGGVGYNKEQHLEISKRLISIRKHNPTLLTDGDKPGLAMKNINGKNSELKVVTLKDIDEQFNDIESLFSQNDLIKHQLIDKDLQPIKHPGTSANFKYRVINNNDAVDNTTKTNFKKVFEALLD